MKSIIIIGGGASGLMAAITAATTARNAGGDVAITVLEMSHRVGRSILTAGNGRCNFYNSHLNAESYRNEAFVKHVFENGFTAWDSSFGVRSKLDYEGDRPVVEPLFENLGLCWRATNDGWCYPTSEKATSVLQVLLETAKTLPITLRCESAAVEVVTTGVGKWSVRLESGEILHSNAVILACGGRGLDTLVLPEGLSLIPQEPILGALEVQEARRLRDLDGFRIKCNIKLASARLNGGKASAKKQSGRPEPDAISEKYETVALEEGEVLFRKYGVSGISVFNLSRFACPGDKLLLDFCPSVSEQDMGGLLQRRYKTLQAARGPVTFGSFMVGMIAEPLARHIIKAVGADPDAPMGKKDPGKLSQAIKAFALTVAGVHDPSQCQVLRGGLKVDDWSSQTLCHSELPGLFAAGEALDVDGPCGGYNLSWAWVSGLVAGNAAALSLTDEAHCAENGFAGGVVPLNTQSGKSLL